VLTEVHAYESDFWDDEPGLTGDSGEGLEALSRRGNSAWHREASKCGDYESEETRQGGQSLAPIAVLTSARMGPMLGCLKIL
jgi:hypothetical protein